VKIYVAAVEEALRKKERQDETQFEKYSKVAIDFLVQLNSDDISSKPKNSRIFGGQTFCKRTK
jgi:hypothetical protein